ncbi:hypothetical protein EVAR_81045_1 [Eumeta japonica]|uniref:Uncharacterized protein n=1 Tax=Eumeta variegata TaxID=151549 RepID=A0A4C1T5I5_EUMVA|nr:hypothetical protein EVAR_81045_1 [Eumeta japonica]
MGLLKKCKFSQNFIDDFQRPRGDRRDKTSAGAISGSNTSEAPTGRRPLRICSQTVRAWSRHVGNNGESSAVSIAVEVGLSARTFALSSEES